MPNPQDHHPDPAVPETIMSLDEIASHLRHYIARQTKLLKVLKDDERLRWALEIHEQSNGLFRGTDDESKHLLEILEFLEEFR